MSSGLTVSIPDNDVLLARFERIFEVEQPTTPGPNASTIRDLFHFITSSEEGRLFLIATLTLVEKDQLYLPDPVIKRGVGSGFAYEAPATANVTGFMLYLIFDVSLGHLLHTASVLEY
jgi:hypothetical protein